uniref:Putative secreted protein n=1 Tax=Anopheles triannulatus TaxID=58253 RepID=A0A2M4B7H0_9DIPT
MTAGSRLLAILQSALLLDRGRSGINVSVTDLFVENNNHQLPLPLQKPISFEHQKHGQTSPGLATATFV